MAIIETRSGSTPGEIHKRLVKRNTKDDMARTLRKIRDVTAREGRQSEMG